MLRNLAVSILIHEKIVTTPRRAKAVSAFIDRLITIGKKKDTMNAIRQIEKLLQHENSSRKILEVLTKRYADRDSGFTTVHKLGYRKGDATEIVQLELLA